MEEEEGATAVEERKEEVEEEEGATAVEERKEEEEVKEKRMTRKELKKLKKKVKWFTKNKRKTKCIKLVVTADCL